MKPGAHARLVLASIVVAATLPASAVAQDALVLSGGGSRGLAHVGVLLGLEVMGHDPDAVVGTSMGAVVGALYAAGYEPEEVAERILGIEWSELFTATPVVVGPAREARSPQVSLDLDLSRLRASRGLVGQWRINRALSALLFDANARSRGDFDRLARRYRAVATDLETGEQVVIASGDLARAARASMAVPGFFAPVRWNGHVLVDGGLVNNLPTSVAREMGAQHIIAVDVGGPDSVMHSLAPFAVIGRALGLMLRNSQRDSIPPDVLVRPQLPLGFQSAYFPANPTWLIQIGLEAALRDLSFGDDYTQSHPLPPAPDSLGELVVEAPDPALAALAHRAFEGVVPGVYDPAAVSRAVDRLYATGLFEGVWPRVEEREGDASPRLVLRLEAPPGLAMAAAASFENDRGGRVWATLDRYARVGRRPAVLTIGGELGGLRRWGAASGSIYPLGWHGAALSVGTYAQEHDVRFFTEDAIGETQVLRAGAWLGYELPHILTDQITNVTVHGEWIDAENSESGIAIGPLVRFASVDADVRVVGTPLLVEAERRWGEITYSRLSLAGSREGAIGSVLAAALVDLRAASSDAPADVLPALGNEHSMPGLRWGEVRGAARALAGIDLAQPVGAGFARLRLRLGGVAPEWDEWSGTTWHAGAQLGALWQSPLGTVDIGYGYTTRGDGRFELRLGRDF